MTGHGVVKFAELASEVFTGETHPLYAARDRIVAEGGTIVDLVRANVTEHGVRFPQDVLQEILNESVEMTAIYRPDPFGQPAAREAIQNYYRTSRLAAKN